jgi:hypothetical protein
MRDLTFGLAVACGFLAIALTARYLEAAGLVDADSSRRATQVVIGLLLAVYGNFMPKRATASGVAVCHSRWSQSALRVGGWAMALAGLLHAAFWAFAPIVWADVAATTVVATATLVTMVYAWWMFASRRRVREEADPIS